MQFLLVAMQYDDEMDPKKPRSMRMSRKGDGPDERAEARKDEGREHHRHVNVRC
jgi:hypothetical protein